jgi:hypothetical protein
MMNFKELDKDSLGYVGSIKECISNRDDIRAIQVCFKTLIFLDVDRAGPQRSRL